MFRAYTRSTNGAHTYILPLLVNEFDEWLNNQSEFITNWITSSGFKPDANKFCFIPNAKGQVEKIVLLTQKRDDLWAYAQLSSQLPGGLYCINNEKMTSKELNQAALGWGLGTYYFSFYQKQKSENPQLIINEHFDTSFFEPMVEATYLIRDLINTPAEDLTPHDLAKETMNLAHSFGAMVVVTSGKDLITKNYPAIYTVGRASPNIPQLIDLTWGESKRPKLTLVGKGVCFDSGGLNIKSAKAMELMKKDMAGAAHVLGLAYLIMKAKLPVRLRVLIPAVENAVDGLSYRPGDVIKMRKGTTVEIGNTDAEGRLVLADALTEASDESPHLIIDMASLTGAARVALGAEVPIFFTNKEDVAKDLFDGAKKAGEDIWRLPLYQPYKQYIQSKIADLNNASSNEYGGAITAALFLQSFVSEQVAWVHFDLMGWNISDLPGRKVGGEAMGIRAIFQFLQDRYG